MRSFTPSRALCGRILRDYSHPESHRGPRGASCMRPGGWGSPREGDGAAPVFVAPLATRCRSPLIAMRPPSHRSRRMSELIHEKERRKELLEHMIRQLHAGEAPDEVRARLIHLLGRVPYDEVVEVEQKLIADGMPIEEILRCATSTSRPSTAPSTPARRASCRPATRPRSCGEENKALDWELQALGRIFARLGEAAADDAGRRPAPRDPPALQLADGRGEALPAQGAPGVPVPGEAGHHRAADGDVGQARRDPRPARGRGRDPGRGPRGHASASCWPPSSWRCSRPSSRWPA